MSENLHVLYCTVLYCTVPYSTINRTEVSLNDLFKMRNKVAEYISAEYYKSETFPHHRQCGSLLGALPFYHDGVVDPL